MARYYKYLFPIILLLLQGCGDSTPNELPPNVVSVSISDTEFEFGESSNLSLFVEYSNGQNDVVKSEVQWTVNNERIAKIKGDNVIEFFAGGKLELTAVWQEYELNQQVFIKTNSNKLWLPSLSSYHEDTWQAYSQRNAILFRNTSYPEMEIPTEFTWEENPYNDRSWSFLYHNLYWLHGAAYGFDNYGDEAAKKFIFETIEDWYLKNKDAPASEMAWNDHSVSNRAANIVYFFQKYFAGSLSEDELAEFDENVYWHGLKLAEFIESGRWAGHNHSFFHAMSLYTISRTFAHFEESEQWERMALENITILFDELVYSAEGVTNEQAIAYHNNALNLFVDAALLIKNLSADEIAVDLGIISRMAEFSALASKPNKTLPAIGDTVYGQGAADWILRKVKDAGLTTNVLDYILSQGESGIKPEKAYFYPDSGYHIFRAKYSSDDWDNDEQLFVDLGSKAKGHGHQDALSFSYYSQQQALLIDSGGPFSYTAPGTGPRYEYFIRAKAHNTLTINDEDYQDSDTITLMRYGMEDAFSYVTGERETVSGANHFREIVMLDSGQLLVADNIAKSTTNDFGTLYYHFAPENDVVLKKVSGGYLVTAENELGTHSMHIASEAELSCIVLSGIEEDGKLVQGWVTRSFSGKEAAPVVECRVSSNNSSDWIFSYVTKDSGGTLSVILGGSDEPLINLPDSNIQFAFSRDENPRIND